MSVAPTAPLLRERLAQRLAPTKLEVIDESYQHAGHVGANDSGVGTHFRVGLLHICLLIRAAWRVIALCMMRCKISLTKGCMLWPLRLKHRRLAPLFSIFLIAIS
jgi:BolA-like protein